MRQSPTFAPYARYWRWVALLTLGKVIFGVRDAVTTRWLFALLNGVCAVFFAAVTVRLRAMDPEPSAD